MDPIIFLLVLVACILVLGPGTHATNSFRRRHTRRNQKTIENNAIHKSVKKARLRHHLMTTHHGGVIHSQVHLNHVQEPHHGHDTKHHRWECLCPPSSPFCLQENGMEEIVKDYEEAKKRREEMIEQEALQQLEYDKSEEGKKEKERIKQQGGAPYKNFKEERENQEKKAKEKAYDGETEERAADRILIRTYGDHFNAYRCYDKAREPKNNALCDYKCTGNYKHVCPESHPFCWRHGQWKINDKVREPDSQCYKSSRSSQKSSQKQDAGSPCTHSYEKDPELARMRHFALELAWHKHLDAQLFWEDDQYNEFIINHEKLTREQLVAALRKRTTIWLDEESEQDQGAQPPPSSLPPQSLLPSPKEREKEKQEGEAIAELQKMYAEMEFVCVNEREDICCQISGMSDCDPDLACQENDKNGDGLKCANKARFSTNRCKKTKDEQIATYKEVPRCGPINLPVAKNFAMFGLDDEQDDGNKDGHYGTTRPRNKNTDDIQDIQESEGEIISEPIPRAEEEETEKIRDPRKNEYMLVKEAYRQLQAGFDEGGAFANLDTAKIDKVRTFLSKIDKDPSDPGSWGLQSAQHNHAHFTQYGEFKDLQKMVKLLATWNSSPVLQSVLRWNGILDLVWKGKNSRICTDLGYKKGNSNGIEHFASSLLIAMHNGIDEFITSFIESPTLKVEFRKRERPPFKVDGKLLVNERQAKKIDEARKIILKAVQNVFIEKHFTQPSNNFFSHSPVGTFSLATFEKDMSDIAVALENQDLHAQNVANKLKEHLESVDVKTPNPSNYHHEMYTDYVHQLDSWSKHYFIHNALLEKRKQEQKPLQEQLNKVFKGHQDEQDKLTELVHKKVQLMKIEELLEEVERLKQELTKIFMESDDESVQRAVTDYLSEIDKAIAAPPTKKKKSKRDELRDRKRRQEKGVNYDDLRDRNKDFGNLMSRLAHGRQLWVGHQPSIEQRSGRAAKGLEDAVRELADKKNNANVKEIDKQIKQNHNNIPPSDLSSLEKLELLKSRVKFLERKLDLEKLNLDAKDPNELTRENQWTEYISHTAGVQLQNSRGALTQNEQGSRKDIRAAVYTRMTLLWDSLSYIFFDNYNGYPRGKKPVELELELDGKAGFKERLVSLMEHVEGSLAATLAVQQAYFDGPESKKTANKVRATGSAVAIAGAMAALGGGFMGLGPAVGTLGKNVLNQAAQYFEPNAEVNQYRHQLKAMTDFLLTGDTRTEFSRPAPPCSFRDEEDKEGKHKRLEYLMPVKTNFDGTFVTTEQYLDYKDPNRDEKYKVIRDAGLCDSAVSRLKRIRYTLYFLNAMQSCHRDERSDDLYSDYDDNKTPIGGRSCTNVCKDRHLVCDSSRMLSASTGGKDVYHYLLDNDNLGKFCFQVSGWTMLTEDVRFKLKSSSFDSNEDKYIKQGCEDCPKYDKETSECWWDDKLSGTFNCDATPEKNFIRICPCTKDINKKLPKDDAWYDAYDAGVDEKHPLYTFPEGVAKIVRRDDPWIQAYWGGIQDIDGNRKDEEVARKVQHYLDLTLRSQSVLTETIKDGGLKAFETLNELDSFGASIWGTPGALVGGTYYSGLNSVQTNPSDGNRGGGVIMQGNDKNPTETQELTGVDVDHQPWHGVLGLEGVSL